MRVDFPDGLKLEEIYAGTPASTGRGLKKGDTIVAVGEKIVQNEREFLLAVDAAPGDKPPVLKVTEPGALQPERSRSSFGTTTSLRMSYSP